MSEIRMLLRVENPVDGELNVSLVIFAPPVVVTVKKVVVFPVKRKSWDVRVVPSLIVATTLNSMVGGGTLCIPTMKSPKVSPRGNVIVRELITAPTSAFTAEKAFDPALAVSVVGEEN